jgi:PAT family beta-lactamase induction signal transducer AmpG
MDKTRARWFRLSLFALLYFVQGSALAYFRNFQKPYLNRLNVDPDRIGLLTAILLLPFVLKIFLGMLSDRVNLLGLGHRKPYILLGLLLAAVTFGATAFVSPADNLFLFSLLVIGGSFSVTVFDSATDGLAIDVTPRDEQGAVQGTMVGGRAAGIIILSLVFGALVERTGYRVVFLIIAASMLIPLLWVVWMREPRTRSETRSFQWRAFGALGRPRFLIFAAYAVLYSIVSFGVDGLVTLYLSDHFEVAESAIGRYGALRGAGAVAGALVSGLLIDRVGRRRSAYAAVLLVSLGAILIGVAPAAGVLVLLGGVWGIVWSFQETLFFALAMDLADARIAASMFAIMMAISNLGTAVGEGVATGLTDNLPFSSVFLLLAAFNVTLFPVLWALFRVAPEIALRPTEL